MERSLVVYDIPDEVLQEEEYFEKKPLNVTYADGLILIFDPFSDRNLRTESQKLGEIVPRGFYLFGGCSFTKREDWMWK